MKQILTGNVFDIQRYTLNDGPGIRTEIFLQGCDLKCPWCHSPDSQSYNGDLAWFPMLCVGIEKCGTCISSCPNGAIEQGGEIYSKLTKTTLHIPKLDRKKCNTCGDCAKVCYPKAFYLTCRQMSVDEIMEIIKKDMRYYHTTNGGVTLSGGEPMVQSDFTAAILKECKSLCLHTALDTTGFVSWSEYEKVIDYVDLFLFDLKCMSSDRSEELVGVPNELILENAKRLAKIGKKIQIRYPIIPTLNDQKENLVATASFCRDLGDAVTVIQLLPYHRLGTVKYERIGKDYTLGELEPMSDTQAEEYAKIFHSYGLKTIVG